MSINTDGHPSHWISARAPETTMLVDYLKGRPEGEVCSYTELTDAIGKDCAPHLDGYGYLQSALSILRRELGEYWGNIPKVGYKRLDPTEQLEYAKGQQSGAKRKLRRTEMALVNGLDYERLNEDEKRERDGRLWSTRIQRVFMRKPNIGRIGHEAQKQIANSTTPDADFVKRVIGLFAK